MPMRTSTPGSGSTGRDACGAVHRGATEAEVVDGLGERREGNVVDDVARRPALEEPGCQRGEEIARRRGSGPRPRGSKATPVGGEERGQPLRLAAHHAEMPATVTSGEAPRTRRPGGVRGRRGSTADRCTRRVAGAASRRRPSARERSRCAAASRSSSRRCQRQHRASILTGVHSPAAGHPNWYWQDQPAATGPAVVFDMDGVLADASGRQHLLERPYRDWDGFFEACGDDPLIDEVGRAAPLPRRRPRHRAAHRQARSACSATPSTGSTA